jgi:polyribonucleotide nucleotidyltransferase
MVKTYRLEDFKYDVVLGKYAQQADGAAWFQCGETVMLATVCSAPSKEFPGFFPLTVEYREEFSAAGKIPGGYFKREGRPSEQEILTSRLVDRAIRPLFPADYFDQVQVIITVFSADKNHPPQSLALTAASIALSVSSVPFLQPVAGIEMTNVDGKWKTGATFEEIQNSNGRVVVAGTKEGIVMVEGSANELAESEFLDVMFEGHAHIKSVVAWQEKIQAESGKEQVAGQELHDSATWNAQAMKFMTSERVLSLCKEDKAERDAALQTLRDAFIEENKELLEETHTPSSFAMYYLEGALKEKITEYMFNNDVRVDGRAFDQIRKIIVEVGMLPQAHGSAMFQRGQTQALVSVTLGSGDDAQKTETLLGSEENQDGSFMLHYNFPPYSVGEVRFLRGAGRREIGHGNLAASALKAVRPSKEEFPYTIRIISDILESNGSTSMATTCGATMALMQAGVPIKKMVGGNAMGMIMRDGEFKILSDITGFEDNFGMMDFKVAGTDEGITAIQMDIKYKGGLEREVFQKAFDQARKGRAHILGKMREVMSKPSEQLSPLVPRVTTLKIDTDKIGAVIGSGGKTIREIIAETGTQIDIEADGLVKIYGGIDAKTDLAINWIKTLVGQIEQGQIFEGKVKRAAEFGLFVELVPGVQGLVHISKIPREKQKSFMQDYPTDTPVRVKVLDYDDSNGRISLQIINQ